MEVGSLFFLLAIIVVVLIIITHPFYQVNKVQTKNLEELPTRDDDAEYQSIVRNLRELTADFELGKISDSDYELQRRQLEGQAFQWMQEVETTGEASAAPVGADREIEAMIHSRRMTREEQTAGFCPKCGKPVQKSDQFCPSCGEPTRLSY